MNRIVSFHVLFVLFITASFFSHHAFSDPQEKTFYDHVDWAKSVSGDAYKNPNMTLDLSDFCADDNPGCEEQIKRPDEAGMNASQLTDQSTTEYYNNEQAQAIQEGFNNNKGQFNPNDEAYQYATIGIDNAYEISHGISNPYVDCDAKQQCNIEFIPKTCHQPTLLPVPCLKEPSLTPELGTVHYTCPAGWTRNGIKCERMQSECRYNDNNYIYKGAGCYSNVNHYIWNGRKVSPSDFSTGAYMGRFAVGPCGYLKAYQICGAVKQTIPAALTCDEGFTLSGENCVQNVVKWETKCTLLPECAPVSETCLEGQETRVINGVPTTLDCWKYEVQHECQLNNTCAPLPSNCTTQSQSCSTSQLGVCVEDELQLSCPQEQCSSTDLICGETSFCLDGDCFEGTPTQSDDFNQAAAGLAALAKAAEGLGDPPKIFTGEGMKCTDKAFGFADCCKDSGWGVGSGLAQCNEEEKSLGQAKEQGTTIYLGSYCASETLGVCTRRKKGYCVYDSKLARIVQNQGVKQQLGISLGSAKRPLCEPITPEQLQQIDFKRIDFSDFYDDMHDNANLPSAEEIQNRLQSTYGD